MRITIDVDRDLMDVATREVDEQVEHMSSPGQRYPWMGVVICHRAGLPDRKLMIRRNSADVLTIRQERP